jgi:hypothetical protein
LSGHSRAIPVLIAVLLPQYDLGQTRHIAFSDLRKSGEQPLSTDGGVAKPYCRRVCGMEWEIM